MTLRHTLAAILFFAAHLIASPILAIDENLVISPNRVAETDDTATDDAMTGLFTGEGSSIGMIVTIFGYVIILGGLALAAWFLFKRGLIRKPFSNSEGKLKVAETRMLGNRQFIMVVEYEDQKILLGVGPGKIDYLTNLNTYRSEFPSLEPIERKSVGGKA